MKKIICLIIALVFLLAAVPANASQNDYSIPTTGTLSGLTMVEDINAADQALASNNLGASAPATPYAGMTWVDNSASIWAIKKYDGSHWATQGYIDPTTNYFFPVAGAYALNDDRFKNRIINAEMQVSQRNGSSAETITAGAAINYTLDRWYNACTGGNVTVAQTPGGNGYKGSMTITGGAGVLTSLVGQRIEGSNIMDLVGWPVTFRANFKKTGSAPSTITWTLYYANAVNDFTAKTQIATNTWTITTTATEYSATVILPANAANGVALEFSTGAFGADTIVLTGVQLERGDLPSLFHTRPYSEDLRLCQRYFTKLGGEVASDIWFNGYATAAATNVGMAMSLPATMLRPPTGTRVGTWTVTNCGQPTSPLTTSSTTFNINCAASALGMASFRTADTTTYLTFEAEL